MNEDAARELIEFVGQLAGSVALLTRGMTDLMTVVEAKDREIKSLQEKVLDIARVTPVRPYASPALGYDFSDLRWTKAPEYKGSYEFTIGGGGGGGSK